MCSRMIARSIYVFENERLKGRVLQEVGEPKVECAHARRKTTIGPCSSTPHEYTT